MFPSQNQMARNSIYSNCTLNPFHGSLGLKLMNGKTIDDESVKGYLEIGKRYCEVLKNIDDRENALKPADGPSTYEGLMLMFRSDKERGKWKERGERTYGIIVKALKSLERGSEGPSEKEIGYCTKTLDELSFIAENKLWTFR